MKILLLGLSGAGKTSVSKLLAEKFDLEIIEADDEVMRENLGLWPQDDDFITRVFEETNERVIGFNNFIYVISWMDEVTIKKFKEAGFKIIEMHAEFETLSKRKINRDNEIPERIEKFKNTYISYFNTILNDEMKQYYDLSIDATNMSTQEIFDLIATKMNS